MPNNTIIAALRPGGGGNLSRIKRFGDFLAFTLAEVLIVLGIIGIIAEMTIPTLMQNVQDREVISRLKKVYSTLSNSFNLATNENGSPETWFSSGDSTSQMETTVFNNLSPYIHVLKKCGATGSASSDCFSLDFINKTAGFYTVNLSDGTMLVIQAESANCSLSYGSSTPFRNICGCIIVDVNGFKKPNSFGKDMFYFYFTKYGVVPSGAPDMNDYAGSGELSKVCNILGSGSSFGCAAWVIQNDNMDYLKCNDLNWNGKNRCS